MAGMHCETGRCEDQRRGKWSAGRNLRAQVGVLQVCKGDLIRMSTLDQIVEMTVHVHTIERGG